MPEDTRETPTARTLVDLLQRQAARYQDKVAFSFSYNGDDQDRSQLTYHELDTRARAIGAGLQQQGAAGRRVLVFCRPGLDGIVGLFGCLYAGAVAVPVHQKLAPRLSAVIPDAQADFAVAATSTQANVRAAVDLLTAAQPLRWLASDVIAADPTAWVSPDIDDGTTALIQYTSGSTTSPNGVVVTHRNLLHNLAAIDQAWGGDDQEIAVYWLPQHHDMGLIGCVLEMVYLGCTTHLMSPSAFIQRPMRWLEAISRHRGTFTVAPNFAYNLCVERSTPEERAALDLSSLCTAMNGAEPVQVATMRAFSEAFAPAGFRPGVFMPVYGLAESTLLVSGGPHASVPVVHHIDRVALQQDRVIDAASPEEPTAAALVGCGAVRGGQDVVIADPETRRRCGNDEVGEIWVAGPSVARGYWGKPKETEQTFSAYLAETGAGPFLRTGDLGFLRSGALFVTGRCKDLVVLGGYKYYPNDIELTVAGCHPGLVSGRGAVFSVAPESGGEQLVVVQEVELPRVGEAELTEIVQAIQAAIAQHHGIQPHTVVLAKRMQIPTTSSGKIQRGKCRQQFLDRELETVAEWYAPLPPEGDLNTQQLAAGLLKAALAQQARGVG